MKKKKGADEKNLDKKEAAQIAHFKKRCKERYAINVNRSLYKDMVSLIGSNRAVFIEKQSNRVTVFWLYLEKEYEGTRIKVVYDKIRKTLITALPLENQENNE